MRLALWADPPADLFAAGAEAVAASFDVERHRPEVCAARLLNGDADVALLPTTLALQGADGFDVLPGVGLVAWRYPYARLAWPGGLGDLPATVAHDRRALQETLLARVLLHEHYGAEPTFAGYDAPSLDALVRAGEDAALLVGPDVPAFVGHRAGLDLRALDLGREWYELTNYPMVWGLFVTKRGRATDALIGDVVALRQAAEAARADVAGAHADGQPVVEAFFRDDLRTALDRLAVASLTELRQYLFYYGHADDVPDLPFVYLDDADGPRDGTLPATAS